MVAPTKVLVVDDSLTMRVLLSGALERIPNVVVVGAADGAAEARAMVADLKPDVMTLDVEMPGMSGLEYLAEMMTQRPMPVIMFSTRTEAGAEASVEALRLGAIDCFPKPKVAAPAEFEKMLARLGKRIKASKGVIPQAAAADLPDPAAAGFDWNGCLLAVGGEASSTRKMFEMFSAFPADCPPTLVVQHLAPGLAETLIAKLGAKIAPKIVMAEDRLPIEQGTIYLAPPGDAHLVVDAWPHGRLRMLAREPVAGERPSISILFASIAKVAGGEAVGILLDADGEDGGAGIQAMRAAGCYGVLPADDRADGYVLGRGGTTQKVAADRVSHDILKLCSR